MLYHVTKMSEVGLKTLFRHASYSLGFLTKHIKPIFNVFIIYLLVKPINLKALYHNSSYKYTLPPITCRSQWPSGQGRRSVAARLLILWVRTPLGAWTSVSCECCVLSGRGPCDELTIRPEDSYRLWCVVVCDLETTWMRRPWPTGGGLLRQKQTNP